MIHTLNQKKFFNIALRVSNYESSEHFITLAKNNITNKWIWIDTIDGTFPLDIERLVNLKSVGYKTCLVCPQLPLGIAFNLSKFEKTYEDFFHYIDAVCTKNITFWS